MYVSGVMNGSFGRVLMNTIVVGTKLQFKGVERQSECAHGAVQEVALYSCPAHTAVMLVR